MSLYSRLDRLAADVAKLDRKVDSVSNAPQAQRTSIEAGTMDVNDQDGNLVSTIGLQEDGSGATRFFDGPTPPIPAGFTALADGPLIQGTWDGSFVDGQQATYDLAYLEVAATLVDDGSRVSFATITAKEGASASVVANQSGTWAVAVRSVSQAGKKSNFFSAGTVEVKLVDLAGAIKAVQDSANGKNKVNYSDRPPTAADPGIFDDTWFVGQVGRPNDVVEATNLLPNASFENGLTGYIQNTSLSTNTITTSQPYKGQSAARIEAKAAATTFTYIGTDQFAVTAGQWLGTSAKVRADTTGVHSRTRLIFYSSTGSQISAPYLTDVTALGSNYVGLDGAVEVPAGAVSARLYAYLYSNASGAKPSTGQALVTDAWLAILAHSEATALAAVTTYFDGDTSSGESDNESHYRWTGTPHASTSEKYLPALDIGDSDNWNVIEQYRHDGTGWVKVELSHYVFSTVDLGKATVGELDGIRIMARTITSDVFSGDAFDGIVFRGNTFVTRDGNGEFSDRGLFFQKPDGTAIFRVPTDGTPISMSAADVQIQRAQVDELELVDGEVRSGGVMTLASGVTAPASPAELNASWKRETQLSRPPEVSMDWTGLAYWNGLYVRGVNVLGSTGDSADRIELYNPDGSLNRYINIDLNPRAGVAVIGDVVYTVGPDHVAANMGKQWCHGFNLNTGARVSRWEFVNFFAKDQAQIALGTDGTNLVAAGVAPNVVLSVFKYNPATGTQVGAQLTDTGWNISARELFGVQQIGADIYITHKGSTRVYTVSGSTMTRKTGSSNGTPWAGWSNPNKNAGGMTFLDGVPLVADSGAVYTASEFTSDTTIQACFTWTNGTQETTPSPVASLALQAFESATLSVARRAGLQKRLYVKIGTGAWSRIDLSTDATAFILTGPVGVPASLPSSNTFPASTPAVLKSGIGSFEIKGDGSGKWGPLTFHADGTMSSSAVPNWIPVTTFASGYGPQTWGHVPAYRVWPDGKVEWQGIVAMTGTPASSNNMTTGTADVLTIPALAQSNYPIPVTAASTTGINLRRIEFSPDGAKAMLRVFNGGQTGTWVSLENIYYYKS